MKKRIVVLLAACLAIVVCGPRYGIAAEKTARVLLRAATDADALEKARVVDLHTHPVTDAFREAVSELGIDPIEEDGFPLPKWSVDAQLAFMDEAGIDHAVLSAPTPHLYNGDAQKARKAASRVNDSMAEIVRGNPDRFSFVGCVPAPDVQGAIAETARAMDELGAVGMKVATNMGGVYLGDPAFDPLMEEWDRRHALIIIHPCRARQRPENAITGGVAAIYEYPADTTRAVLNMISRRVMTRYPNIRWVVPHCGAFLPYMSQRFKGTSAILASMGMMETVDVDEELSKLFYDVAGDPEPTQLDMLRTIADDRHIVYGSDFPHSPAKVVVGKKRSLDANPEYDDVREKIYRDNALRLLKGDAK